MDWIEKIVWHEVTTRPPTEEEIEGWAEWGYNEDAPLSYIFDSEMPDDGCDILILMNNGWVFQDTCMADSGCCGYNSLCLDSHGDWDDVVAWAYLPTGKRDMEDEDAS